MNNIGPDDLCVSNIGKYEADENFTIIESYYSDRFTQLFEKHVRNIASSNSK